MAVFFPQAEYAEDQRLYKTILVSHVMHRGFQTGGTVGIAVGTIRFLSSVSKSRPSPSSPNNITRIPPTSTSSTSFQSSKLFQRSQLQPLNVRFISSTSAPTPTSQLVHAAKQTVAKSAFSTIERSMGINAVIWAAATGLMMPGYMYGKETIEWQDRSWRLLANKGQVEVDTWSLAGTAVGIVSLGVRRSSGEVTWRNIAGRVAIGNLVGVVGYMGWRYGFHRGEFE